MANREQQAIALQEDWDSNPRWQGVLRDHTAAEVVRLRGSLCVEHTLARRGAATLWTLLGSEAYVPALGAATGEQAVQQARAGLKAVYLSDWQEQSFYPAMPVPLLARAVNQSLQRADQIQWSEGKNGTDYFVPIVADGEGGAGGALAGGERMRALIEAGAAGVHFDDQLACAKHGGRPGGKVLLPTRDALAKLAAARLAADVMGVPTLLIARTDAEGAGLLSSDIDERDRPFCTGGRSAEGHYEVRPGIEQALARALAYAPYADLLWCETGKPDLAFAKQFAAAVHARFPGKLLAYHCSPAYNWKQHLDDATIAKFQKELGAMGYKFQFISLAGFHALHDGMFKLAHGYARRQMTAFVALQETEFGAAEQGRAAFRPPFFESRQVPQLRR